MPRRIGPNFEDMNRIKEWLATGADVPTIAQNLNIAEEGVRIYVESLEDAKPKRKPRKKASAEPAGEEDPLAE